MHAGLCKPVRWVQVPAALAVGLTALTDERAAQPLGTCWRPQAKFHRDACVTAKRFVANVSVPRGKRAGSGKQSHAMLSAALLLACAAAVAAAPFVDNVKAVAFPSKYSAVYTLTLPYMRKLQAGGLT